MPDILFSDKQRIGMEELQHDVEYRYVPENLKQKLIDYAWQKGESVANRYKRLYPEIDSPEALAERLGVKISVVDSGPDRIFSEYYSNRREIRILKHSICRLFLPDNEDVLTSTDFSHVQKLFVAHEMYHHLECHDPEVGMTYKEFKITVLSIGPFKRNCGLRCLSEIGAHSFTKAYLGIENKF